MTEPFLLVDRGCFERGCMGCDYKDKGETVQMVLQRPWVSLTPEQVKEISLANRPYVIDMVYALEAKLKELNT